MLQPYAEYLPEYYYHIYSREILHLPECPISLEQSIQGIFDLLKLKRFLAAKPVSGTLGKGFYKLAWNGENYLLNNKLSTEKEMRALIISWMETKNMEYFNYGIFICPPGFKKNLERISKYNADYGYQGTKPDPENCGLLYRIW